MSLFAPAYVLRFSCIADKCTHTCCQGWDFDVDEPSAQHYRALTHPYAERIRASLYTDAEGTHIRPLPNGRCPHLDRYGLCRIIHELGEASLCEVCREHPRFYLSTSRGREMGLGLCCEAAARLILSADDYALTVCIEDGALPQDVLPPSPIASLFLQLQDRRIPLLKRRENIAFACNISPSCLTEQAWRELLHTLEYLKEEHRTMFAEAFTLTRAPHAQDVLLERALAYFLYRYASEAQEPNEQRTAITLALFLEQMLYSLLVFRNATDEQTATELARVLSEELEYAPSNIETLFFEISLALA